MNIFDPWHQFFLQNTCGGVAQETEVQLKVLRSYQLKMERETGIEPATSSLGSWRSTAELLPLTRFIVAYYHAKVRFCARPRTHAQDPRRGACAVPAFVPHPAKLPLEKQP